MWAAPDILDDRERMSAIDSRHMLTVLSKASAVLRAPGAAFDHRLQVPTVPRCVFVAGMGGSATVGDLAATIAGSAGAAPVIVVRDYQLPAWADARDLILAVSYSGETDETLAAVRHAATTGIPGVAITSGGQLHDLASDLGWPLAVLPSERLPREGLGELLHPVFSALVDAGVLDPPDFDLAAEDTDAVIEEVAETVPLDANPAKQIAARLAGRVPVIVAAEHLRAAARRWRDQLTENSEVLSYSHELPELNHNGIMGWTHHREGANLHLVFLESRNLLPQNVERYALSRNWADTHRIPHSTVAAPSAGTTLGELIGAILWGDYVSVYLAILGGRDPSKNDGLSWFKSRLSVASTRASL